MEKLFRDDRKRKENLQVRASEEWEMRGGRGKLTFYKKSYKKNYLSL